MKYDLKYNGHWMVVDTDNGTISGDTYASRAWIKENFAGAIWNGSAWCVPAAALAAEIAAHEAYYKRVAGLRDFHPASEEAAAKAPHHHEDTKPCPHCHTYCYGECEIARSYR